MNRKGKANMGMAASQARFLGLTARKTNVEFEGQQINQQRTTLGNQSANYYNQLLGMAVPVPPSVQDYTKTVYTFQDGNLNNNITALVAQSNGLYKVSYVSSWQNDFAPVSNGAAIIFKDGSDYKVANAKLYSLKDNSSERLANDPYFKTLTSAEEITKALDHEKDLENVLKNKFGTDTNWLVRYVMDTKKI